jgi:acyl carrier protein
MGLDSVELLVEIENTFGINIPPKIAEQTSTVGQMYDVVWDLIKQDNTPKCRTQTLFYKLRACLNNEFLIEEVISPVSITEDIIPKQDRRNVWKLLEGQLSLKLPPLVIPRSVTIVLFVISLMVISLMIWLASFYVDQFPIGGLTYFFAVIAALLLIRLSAPLFSWLRIAIPCYTMRDLTLRVLQLNYVYINDAGGFRKEMEMVINNILIDKLGIDAKEISPEKSFVNDLGVD